MSPDLKRKYEITKAEAKYEVATAARNIGDKQVEGSLPFTALTGSGTAIGYLSTKIGNPEIKSEVRGEIGRSAITATISSSVVGVVT